MPNTNCLAGVQCPNCGHTSGFRIVGTAEFLVTDDGTDEFKDVEWTGNSAITCNLCGHVGKVSQFTKPEKGKKHA